MAPAGKVSLREHWRCYSHGQSQARNQPLAHLSMIVSAVAAVAPVESSAKEATSTIGSEVTGLRVGIGAPLSEVVSVSVATAIATEAISTISAEASGLCLRLWVGIGTPLSSVATPIAAKAAIAISSAAIATIPVEVSGLSFGLGLWVGDDHSEEDRQHGGDNNLREEGCVSLGGGSGLKH